MFGGSRTHPGETQFIGQCGPYRAGEFTRFHSVENAMLTIPQGHIPLNRRIIH